MIRRRDDRQQNDSRIRDPHRETSDASRAGNPNAEAETGDRQRGATTVAGSQGDRSDGQADEEGVAEVQGGHRGVLVAEFVLRPDAGFAFGAVHRVDEAEGAGFLSNVTGDVGVGEKTRGHAGPEGEHDEGEEVADGHCAASRFVETGACGRTVGFPAGFVGEWEVETVAGCGVVEEGDEEEDGAWDVDEGVGSVGPVEEGGVFEEPVLEGEFVEEVEALFEVNELEGVGAGDVDGGFDEGEGREGAAELVDLLGLTGYSTRRRTVEEDRRKTHPVYQSPIPGLDQKRKLLQQPTQEVAFKPPRIRRHDLPSEPQNTYLALPPVGLLLRQQRGRSPVPIEQRSAGPRARTTGSRGRGRRRSRRVRGVATAVEDAVFRVAVDPCAAEEEGHHDQWFHEGADAHGGG